MVGLFAFGCARPARFVGGVAPVNVRIQAKKFAFSPAVVHVKRGVVTRLSLVSLDRVHGFSVPGLGIRTDILPHRPTTIDIKPEVAGNFPIQCDVYCGEGHDEMTAELIVDP